MTHKINRGIFGKEIINFVGNTKEVMYKGTRIILKMIIYLRTRFVVFLRMFLWQVKET